jgi:hypothetical protein
MAGQPQQTSKFWRGVFLGVSFVVLLFGGMAGLVNAFGLEAVGPAAATFMLRAFGDPCDGVEHPPFQSEDRGRIVDAVQESRGEPTEPLYAVQKVAVKDNWAYIEAAPLKTGEYDGYLLEATNAKWVVRWNGPVGGQPGQGPKGNPYPDDFDFPDQDILRCQTSCVGG